MSRFIYECGPWNLLKTVIPAQSRGAASHGSISVGTDTTASVRNVAYSAYPPSLKIPMQIECQCTF